MHRTSAPEACETLLTGLPNLSRSAFGIEPIVFLLGYVPLMECSLPADDQRGLEEWHSMLSPLYRWLGEDPPL